MSFVSHDTGEEVHLDAQYWERLYGDARRRILPGLRSWLLSRGDSDAAAEDILQEAFMALFERARAGQLDSSRNWLSLLWVMSRHRAIDRLRRTTRAQKVDEDWASLQDSGQGDAPDHDATTADLARRMRDALAELTLVERQAILARYFEDQSQRRIAGWLGVSEATVSKMLSAARQKLRDRLAT